MSCNSNQYSTIEFEITINPSQISLSRIKGLITEKLNDKPFRMYNFYGIEIIDNCDLNIFRDENEKNKVLFLTDGKELFDNSFLLKIYNLKTKIGEVTITFNIRVLLEKSI